LGYDPSASPVYPADQQFGEKYIIQQDTSRFSAFWSSCCDGVHDTILAINIGGNNVIGGPILFRKGVLPLNMYWDRNAFNSDGLPFIHDPPAPIGQGELDFDFPMTSWYDTTETGVCPFDFPILLTDTIFNFYSCWQADSVQFFDINGNENLPIGILSLRIKQWIGSIVGVGISSLTEQSRVAIYPNPNQGRFIIESENHLRFKYDLYSLAGSRMISTSNVFSNRQVVTCENLTAGLYLLEIITDNHLITYKKVLILN
jgi:hypothetical protein